MRDVALTAFIFGLLPFVFKRPWLGVLLWTWIGMMSPHRLTWGFAYSMQFAAIVGVVTLIALLISKEQKRYPFTPVTATLILLVLWMNVSYLFAINPTSYPYVQWDKVMKIQLFIAVTMLAMTTAERIGWLVWVATMSIAFFGIKGGVFTLTSGGGSMVLGPEGSFISGNTEISLAITMSIPLLRYLQMQSPKRLVRWGLGIGMILCGVAVLGSYSRGGLLAVAAMGGFLWLKSRNKLVIGVALVMLIPVMLTVMPDKWFDRMSTIQTYEQDGSAMGRINAWQMAINLAKDRPLTGGGFGAFTDEAFARWAPNPTDVHDAHSIWFQMLGEHGFVGIGLFILFWALSWRLASGIIKDGRSRPGLRWAGDLAAMIQVSLIGYWVGGSFLGLSYWDMPYVLVTILVMMRCVIDKQLQAVTAASSSLQQPAAIAVENPAVRQGRYG
ncbi:MAG: putative O-glycosylation ligase, exosortase A system-associated [Rhodocyclaceae bacterium]|nr:putative O-glycosylation ligase, exosortase A system-associated [Rhodocyclaceae bacterium]